MAQVFQTQFDSLDGLEQVVNTIEQFCPDRFQYAIFNTHRRLTIDDIDKLDCNILVAIAQLKEQLITLRKFAEDFNQQFVTTNNEFFDSAYVLLRKIRSGTKQIKEVYSKFTPGYSATPPAIPRAKVSSVYERSSLGNAEYSMTLFPIDIAPTSVQQLYEDLTKFFALLRDALLCCIVVIREENAIRQNPELCCNLYKDYKEKHYRQIKDFIKSINIYTQEFSLENNEAIYLREHTKSEEEFSQKGFHKLKKSEVTVLATKELVEQVKNGDYTKEELLLWSDCSVIDSVRYIITNMDAFLPNDYNRKVIPSYLVASLLLWSHPKEAKAFVTYVHNTYNGTYRIPDNSAVNQAKNKINLQDDKQVEYNLLISQWNNL